MKTDIIIIGAGAAGMYCAAAAGKRGRRVLVLDKAKAPGEKIRISGGGRCNFTNLHCSPANFLSQNPHFCVSAMKRHTQHDFIKLVESYGIAYHEKTLGQLFCDDSSKQIIQMLLSECENAGAQIKLNIEISEVTKEDDKFKVQLESGDLYIAEKLVVATGGPSIPKMGASAFGYKMAEQFGVNIIPPRAGLVPLTLHEQDLAKLKPLAGISLPVIANFGKTQFQEAMLFTHRGLSGPAILQISSYWQPSKPLYINLLPQMDILAHLLDQKASHPKQDIATTLSNLLPKRLAEYLCETYGWRGRLADLTNKKMDEISNLLANWEIRPNGTEGYRTAEVTLGGVDTAELSSKTFEAKKVPGLHFIGEVVDVTGHLGGHNFQWAWSSGWACGQHL